MATLVGASIFTSVFLGVGGGRVVTNMILSVGGSGKWAVFIVMMLIVFVAGFFIDWIGIIYITFPIFLPIAKSFGFDPLWFIIALAVNLQMSFLTPPFGYALFYMKGTVPPDIKLSHIYRGVMPFIGLQLAGLILLALFPVLATYLPRIFFG
jgi:TRAP-type mannitol/chloroaromatic compound transport system permease large subunit